jgi:hypothetical protein
MELEYKYLVESNEQLDMSNMKDIVESFFGVDIKDKRRNRGIVDARIVFVNVMIERGYSYSLIGRFIDKDHSTIIHYSRVIEGMLRYDDFKKKYDKCREMFFTIMGSDFPEEILSRPEKKIIDLKLKLSEVQADRDRLYAIEQNHHRLRAIIKLIEMNTSIGEEAEVYKRMNLMFNGMRR